MSRHPASEFGPPPRGASSAAGVVATVEAGGEARRYPVEVRPGLLADLPTVIADHAPAHRYAVVSDSTVAPLYGERVARELSGAGRPAELLTFPAGERHKSRTEWSRLTDRMLESGFGRDSAVVAVGGGVTGDLAGFVAATFMRGVPVVQVPTSLVAMIDASVGGKTGVDVPRGKNLVGAFHPPRWVAADPETVATLPEAERAQGLAEALKHGAILDADYLTALETTLDRVLAAEVGPLTRAVTRSVEIKAWVVSRDEREGGLREVLNFGHTLGHALEAASDFRLPHGSAVASGMVLEARVGERLGVTAPGTADRLARAARALALPAGPPPDLEVERVLDFTAADKKARGGRARYVLLEAPGRVARTGRGWSRPVDDAVVREVLEEALEEV